MFDSRYLFEDKTGCELPASQYALKIASGDDYLLGQLLRPHGGKEERHPLVLLCHGFPGNEQLRDLAAALRNAGACVAYFHYRGCWGSSGDYKLQHLPDDATAVLNHVLDNAEKYHVDPERVYVVGHSMGGFCAMHLLSRDLPIKSAVVMAPCDIARRYKYDQPRFVSLCSNKEAWLRNGTLESFTAELEQYQDQWIFPQLAKKFDPAVPVRFITADKDALTAADNVFPAMKVMEELGCTAEHFELPAGHSFDACRIRMIRLVADWIAQQESK
jgi:pimeloyl-ACP methyl ester carboxylesterase